MRSWRLLNSTSLIAIVSIAAPVNKSGRSHKRDDSKMRVGKGSPTPMLPYNLENIESTLVKPKPTQTK